MIKVNMAIIGIFVGYMVMLSPLDALCQIPSYVSRNGLQGWWPFNGNANDESGKENNGTVLGAVLAADRFNVPDRAYQFLKGSNLICTSKSTATPNTMTFSAWIRCQEAGFIMTFDDGQCAHGFNWDRTVLIDSMGYVRFYTYNGPSEKSVAKFNIMDEQWHHIVVTMDKDGAKLYVDSKLLCSVPDQKGGQTYDGWLRFGGLSPNDLNNSFIGAIDEAGWWNRALTQEEIVSLYNSGSNEKACSSFNVIDSVGIDVKNNLTWKSKTLIPGREYYLKGYGVWNAANASSSDEDFCFTYPLPCDQKLGVRMNWVRVGFDLDSMLKNSGLLDPVENGVNCTDHSYTFRMLGNGRPLIVDFRDNPLSDNSGRLSFALYECKDCSLGISSDSILGYRKVETHQVVTYALRNNPKLSYKWIATGGYMLGASTNHFCDVIWGYDKNGSVCCIVSDSVCTDTLCVTSTINNSPTGGIAGDDIETPTMSVKPNPAADMIDISTSLGEQFARYELIDVTGTVVQRTEGIAARMSVADVAPGVYHVVQRDTIGNIIGMQRVVVKR